MEVRESLELGVANLRLAPLQTFLLITDRLKVKLIFHERNETKKGEEPR